MTDEIKSFALSIVKVVISVFPLPYLFLFFGIFFIHNTSVDFPNPAFRNIQLTFSYFHDSADNLIMVTDFHNVLYRFIININKTNHDSSCFSFAQCIAFDVI